MYSIYDPFIHVSRIESIDTVTPIGMTRSDLNQSPDDPRRFYIDLNWTPVNVGEETVCYYASDNNGVSSDQGCFKVVVTNSPENVMENRPEPQPMRSHPTPGETVSPTLKEWNIYYSSN
ncbi:uncharacterized protein LOC117101471, partial [Anneissia japonica]|uniref:uncharacterized protein LOC117101471 n=1 Tax=Anneissia japonica TaxID=1529436 RepID=UPI0014257090